MKLKRDEIVIKVFHHHKTALILRELKAALLSIPFYYTAWLLSPLFTPIQLFIIYVAITVLFILAILYDAILYWLDRLVVTNMRVLHVDWKNIFSRSEHEAELSDIQDIETHETGILSYLPIFDYGTFKLETASSRTSIFFKDAPDPEGIKHFIYHLNLKPNKIRSKRNLTEIDDKERNSAEKTTAFSGRQ